MKSNYRQFFLGATLACYFAFAVAAPAQEPPKPDEKSVTPAAPPAAPAAPAEPAAQAATPPATDEGKSSELRRIDGSPAATPTEAAPANRRSRTIRVNSERNGERIAVGHDQYLPKGEKAETVVAVFGSATSDGEVSDTIVSVLGNTRATGPVGDSAVAVLGSTYVNAKTGGDVVAVLGDVELGPDAEVGGDVVAVGGKVTRDPKAVVRGDVRNIGIGPAFSGHRVDWLLAWFQQCALYGRMLWVGPHLAWAWAVAIGALFIYLLLSLVFRRGIENGVTAFETRPGASILAAVLTTLLAPVLIVLLCVTFVGIAIVPFLAFALLIAVIYGKAIMLAWLGRRFTKFFGDGPLNHPVFAVLVGGLIVMALYMIPVVGIITYKVMKILGLGVVVHMLVNSSRRERPVVATSAAPRVPAPAMAMAGVASPAGTFEAASMTASATLPPSVAAQPPIAAPASTLPRAGFWIRIAALLLDFILVGMLVGFITNLMYRSGPNGPQGFLLGLAVYGAVMWKLKGSTIGGIVCGLKVVRIDGRPVDWPTAIVRALSCFLSMAVAGLGFIWVVIDDDKQSWHDKIAGTTVVRVPKGMALV
jgi:uncharacterized RDD family membrane protein YckC